MLSTILNFFSTKQKFQDGSELAQINRMVLRYTKGHKSLDIGFEMYGTGKLSTKRLIPVWAIESWNDSSLGAVTSSEKEDILDKVKSYCDARNIDYIMQLSKET